MSSPLSLTIAFAIPIVLSPVIAIGSRRLFAIFLREGAELFAGCILHRDLAFGTAKAVAITNVAVFTIAWWFAVGLRAAGLSMFAVIAPFVAAMVLGLFLTGVEVKSRLHFSSGDSWLVGLLAFAGGNLPLILVMPFLLMLVPQG